MKNLKTYFYIVLVSIGVTLPLYSCQRVLQKIGDLTAEKSEAETEQTNEVAAVAEVKGPIRPMRLLRLLK